MSKFKLGSVEHLFSCPLIFFDVADSKRLNKLLIEESKEWRDQSDSVEVSNRGDGWHSPDGLLSRPEPGFSEFAKLVPSIAGEYAKLINPNIKLTDFSYEAVGWVNINRRGGFNTAHHHGTYHLSGVYYVKQPHVTKGEGGMIEFYNSRFDYHIFNEIGGKPFTDAIRIRPKPGTMLVFPSSLLHFVYPNETDEERISIAWNARFAKKTVTQPLAKTPGAKGWKPKVTANPTIRIPR
jgi:uncharacterized protein (TIGR02466 family)